MRANRPGAVLLVVAIAIVALTSMVALVVDVGMLLLARTEAQRAADAAALAGASAFLEWDPVDTVTSGTAYDSALARAYDYAERQTMLHNPIVSTEVTPTIILDSQKVRVSVHRAGISLIFARIFGVNTGGVSAEATAEAVQAGGATTCVKPFAIPDMWHEGGTTQDHNGNEVWEFEQGLDKPPSQSNVEDWSFDASAGDTYDSTSTGYYTTARNGVGGTYYDETTGQFAGGETFNRDAGRRIPLKVQFPGDGSVPSYWFPWRMPGAAGTSDYTAEIKGCVQGVVPVGQQVQTETGMVSMPTYQAIRDLIDNGDGTNPPQPTAVWNPSCQCPVKSPTDPTPIDPDHSSRVFTVAVFNPQDMWSGMHEMRFVNFARVFLEDPDVVYSWIANKQKRPITGRMMKFAPGTGGPNQGTLVKRLRLINP